MKKILPILFIVVSAGLYFTYLDPAYTSITQLRAEEAELTNALQKAEEFLALLGERQATYNTFTSENIDKLDALLPPTFSPVDYLRSIDQLARNHGLRIRGISMEDTAGGEEAAEEEDTRPYGLSTLQFSVVAGYGDFLAFMRDIERNLRLTDVTSLAIKPQAIDARYTFTVGLTTYWLKQE